LRDTLHALTESKLRDFSSSVIYYQNLKWLSEITHAFLRPKFSKIFWTMCDIKNSIM